MALLNAMEVAEASGHDAELIEPVETDAEVGKISPSAAAGQTNPTGKGEDTVPYIEITKPDRERHCSRRRP